MNDCILLRILIIIKSSLRWMHIHKKKSYFVLKLNNTHEHFDSKHSVILSCSNSRTLLNTLSFIDFPTDRGRGRGRGRLGSAVCGKVEGLIRTS